LKDDPGVDSATYEVMRKRILGPALLPRRTRWSPLAQSAGTGRGRGLLRRRTAAQLNLRSILGRDRAGALPRRANNRSGWRLISRSRSNACAPCSMNPNSRAPRNSRCDCPSEPFKEIVRQQWNFSPDVSGAWGDFVPSAGLCHRVRIKLSKHYRRLFFGENTSLRSVPGAFFGIVDSVTPGISISSKRSCTSVAGTK
jgi:hypothetical protein